MNRLLVRADASKEIGFGHVTRCLSLVNQLNVKELFWFSKFEIQSVLQSNCQNYIGFQLITNEDDFLSFVRKDDIVLVDSYTFSLEHQQDIRSKGAFLILIDDLADRTYATDLIINPTPGFRNENYRTTTATQILSGIDYALLRQPFLEMARKDTLEKTKNTVLICFGGSDPLNHTATTLELALKEDFTSIHVVLGSGYAFTNSLADFNDERIFFHSNLNATEIAELMAKCEWGVYPCSGILLEGLACQQKIIGGLTADNQVFVYQSHKEIGSIIDAKTFSVDDLKQAFSVRYKFQAPKHLIDGKSIERIVKTIERMNAFRKLTLRKALPQDVEITFQWATNSVIRRYSFEQHEIKLTEHQQWYLNKLQDTNCFYYLLEDHEHILGSIRFDVSESTALISYLIDPKFHGKGIGLYLLKAGMEKLIEDNKGKTIHFEGHVMSENIGSIRIFEQLGFQKNQTESGFQFIKTLPYHV